MFSAKIQSFLAILVTVWTSAECDPLTVYNNYAPDHTEYKPTDYSFSYGVKDLYTGDVKHQWEKKEGDHIKGQYSLVEPDGSIRTVDYTADKKTGFNAVVKHSQPSHHPIVDRKPTSHKELVLTSKSVSPSYTYLEQQQQDQEGYEGYGNSEEHDFEYEGHEKNEDSDSLNDAYNHKEEVVSESKKNHVKTKPKITVQEEYENLSVIPHLPVDINSVKKDTFEKIIPLDVSLINPVEIDLSKSNTNTNNNKYSEKDVSVVPSHELSKEELKKYLEDYYKNSQEDITYENGFKPIRKQNKNVVSQPSVPQTYKPSKKPMTTPGLKNYSSNNNNSLRNVRYPQRRNKYVQNRGAKSIEMSYFPSGRQSYFNSGNYQNELNRLYRSISKNNGYVRYAKHIKYHQL